FRSLPNFLRTMNLPLKKYLKIAVQRLLNYLMVLSHIRKPQKHLSSSSTRAMKINLNKEHVMANKIQAEFSESINIGINTKDRKEVCKSLSRLLADSYLLYLKTQNYHWNVTGKLFQPLHVLFEEQYKDLAEAIDTIAERIRALGEFAPGSFSAFVKLTSIKEETS